MTPAQLQTIEEIYRAALDVEPDQLNAFLDTACNGDEVSRRKVEALLSSREHAADFIETSAVGLATKIIQTEERNSLLGQMIGHYKISAPIGTGGMGEVYLASDVTAGRKAALKLLPFRFTGDVERLKRFQQEARAVVGLNHPNILTVYEIGAERSTHYIASELIEGETLRQRLMRGPIPVREAVEIATQIASALVAAHDAGVVHRDIKPENVMLRPDGYVKVLDFGIAKLAEQEVPVATPKDQALLLVETNLGSILGTVRYMSPEQACGGQIDERTDIWSLGVVLYEMVTEHPPFTGNTSGEVMSAILEKEPPALTNYIARCSAEFQRIINTTLRKDRDERYDSAHKLLDALKDVRRKLEAATERSAAPLWLRWARSPAVATLVLIAAALAAAVSFNWNRKPTTSSRLDKSIAVLPFENLSHDKENAFFADGVQDELLSNLSKISDLKVISRTSVMPFKSNLGRNLKTIAQELGVANVVEGSVGRSGDRVRVSVQLIDARTDTHVWTEHYDRDATDVFAIQSEIAQQIAKQLQAKLSPMEKAEIAERPTDDLVAYAFYTKANKIEIWNDWEGADKSMNQKLELLDKAIKRDPNFALAYCALAKAQIELFDGDSARHELAKQAAEAALRIRPDLGEGHLELARYYSLTGVFNGDYGRAREELRIARHKLPNNPEALFIEANIDRHQNRWDASLANFQKANELDPRHIEIAWYLARTYLRTRRYHDLEQFLSRDAVRATLEPSFIQLLLADMKLAQADPVAAKSLLEQVPQDFSPAPGIWETRFLTALYLRDYDAANRVIAGTPPKWANEAFEGQPPESWADAQVARARGDRQKALAIFAATREKVDKTWGNRPKDDVGNFALIARLDAGLGRKEEAIREAQHAVDLDPVAKDSFYGPTRIANLALVYAWTGERDRALEQLEKVATLPGLAPTYGDLRFNPCWDELRGDSRFDKIVAATKAASR